jgi:glycine cleavage system H protein
MTVNVPDDLRYTQSHEWVRRNADGSCTIGITDHAQHALGDVVFVEPPTSGRRLAAGDACAVVESVKAASDVYSPIDGTVMEGNSDLAGAPEQVNQDPYGAGWLFRIAALNPAAIENLLTAEEYRNSIIACGS